MKVTVKLSEGIVQNVSVIDDNNDVVLNIARRSSVARHCLIVGTKDGLQVYRITRTQAGRKLPIRPMLNLIEEDLKSHYNLMFRGVFWGKPSYSVYNEINHFVLNSSFISTWDGEVTEIFNETLSKVGLSEASKEGLVEFIKYFTFQTPEPEE
ncbi:hypothetical protein TOTORO_00300 [Serratia phage vB_SmaS-Totoro]|nr:hypothetical protein TOTORO_00300 [Serratia phage vB_SmaS-Totoro]